jgi:hypothetical protein
LDEAEKIMTRRMLWGIVLGLLLMLMQGPSSTAVCEEPKGFIPDKALCAKMLRFGKEAYERGKYLDAKEYFRKAVQADPTSTLAWRSYDQAVIFALAEKVEKNANLVLPDTSSREETRSGALSAPQPATTPPAAKKGTGFKIVEDEGC